LGLELRKNGLSSRCPLQPGHGTHVKNLQKTDWSDIEVFAEREFLNYAARHQKVILLGESSGITPALRLAIKYPDKVAGIVSVGGSILFKGNWIMTLFLPIYKFLRPISRKGRIADVKDRSIIKNRLAYRHIPTDILHQVVLATNSIRGRLSEVKVPLLIQQAVIDHAVNPKSAQLLFKRTSSSQKKLCWYRNSYHVLLEDHDKKKVVADICTFVQSLEGPL
jgi:carboxylesterase